VKPDKKDYENGSDKDKAGSQPPKEGEPK
jgi:hypothetical protein